MVSSWLVDAQALSQVFASNGQFILLCSIADGLLLLLEHFYYCFRLLRVEWSIFGETVCERLQRDANAGVGGAFKAAALETVQVNVTGMDLFNFTRPVLFGALEEGLLLPDSGSGFVSMAIDTNPHNLANFKRAKSTSRNVRAAGLVLKGMSELFNMGTKDT